MAITKTGRSAKSATAKPSAKAKLDKKMDDAVKSAASKRKTGKK
jgi:hypothetical protein